MVEAQPSLAAHTSSGTFQRGFSCFVLKLRDVLLHPDGLCLQWGGRSKRGRRFLRVPRNGQPGAGVRRGLRWAWDRCSGGIPLFSPGCAITKLRILRELRDKKQSPFRKLEMAVLSHMLFHSPLRLPPSALPVYFGGRIHQSRRGMMAPASSYCSAQGGREMCPPLRAQSSVSPRLFSSQESRQVS